MATRGWWKEQAASLRLASPSGIIVGTLIANGWKTFRFPQSSTPPVNQDKSTRLFTQFASDGHRKADRNSARLPVRDFMPSGRQNALDPHSESNRKCPDGVIALQTLRWAFNIDFIMIHLTLLPAYREGFWAVWGFRIRHSETEKRTNNKIQHESVQHRLEFS